MTTRLILRPGSKGRRIRCQWGGVCRGTAPASTPATYKKNLIWFVDQLGIRHAFKWNFHHKIFEYGVTALNLMGSEKKLDNMDLFSSCILFTGDLKRKISLFHNSSWSDSTAPLKPFEVIYAFKVPTRCPTSTWTGRSSYHDLLFAQPHWLRSSWR